MPFCWFCHDAAHLMFESSNVGTVAQHFDTVCNPFFFFFFFSL